MHEGISLYLGAWYGSLSKSGDTRLLEPRREDLHSSLRDAQRESGDAMKWCGGRILQAVVEKQTLTGRAGSSPGKAASSCLVLGVGGTGTEDAGCAVCRCVPAWAWSSALVRLCQRPHTEARSAALIQAMFLSSAVLGMEAGRSCTWPSAPLRGSLHSVGEATLSQHSAPCRARLSVDLG